MRLGWGWLGRPRAATTLGLESVWSAMAGFHNNLTDSPSSGARRSEGFDRTDVMPINSNPAGLDHCPAFMFPGIWGRGDPHQMPGSGLPARL